MNNRRTVKSILLVKKFLGLVNASFSLPEWQAVKLIVLCTLVQIYQIPVYQL